MTTTDGSLEPMSMSDGGVTVVGDVAAAPDGATVGASDAGGDAGADAASPAVGRSWYVDPAAGLDTQDGSEVSPFQTIAWAASTAMAGDVIRPRDGVYAPPVEAGFALKAKAGEFDCRSTSGVHIPDGVAVHAVNRGGAKLSVTGSYGLCLDGSSSLHGLALQLPAADAVGVEGKAGVITIEETTVGTTNGSGVSVDGVTSTGTAKVTIVPGTLASYSVLPASRFARVLGSAELVVKGGTIEQSMFATNGLLDVQNDGKLTLDRVKLVMRPAGAVPARMGVYATGKEVVLKNGCVVRFSRRHQTGWSCCVRRGELHAQGQLGR